MSVKNLKNPALSFFIVSLMLVATLNLHAQSNFQAAYNLTDRYTLLARAIATSDSGFFVLQWSRDTTLDIDYVGATKIDADGNAEWTREITATMPYMSQAQETGDSGFAFCYVEQLVFNRPIHLVKLDKDGNLVLSKRYETEYWFYVPVQLLVKSGGGFYIGTTSRDHAVFKNLWTVISTDDTGAVLWTGGYQAGENSNLSDLDTCSNGDLVLTGSYPDPAQMGLGTPCLTKISSSGSVIWSRRYLCAGHSLGTEKTIITPTDEIVVTCLEAVGSYWHFVVFKTDPLGNISWAHNFNAVSSLNMYPRFVNAAGNDIIVGGSCNPGSFAVKLNSTGATVFTQYYPQANYDFMDPISTGHYVHAGSATVPSSAFILFSVDSAGQACTSQPFPATKTSRSFTSLPPLPDSVMTVTLLNDTLQMSSNSATHLVTCGFVNVQETAASSVSIYPQPATDLIFVQSDKSFERAQLTDMSGKVVRETTVCARGCSFDIYSIPAGVYVLNLQSGSLITRHKVVVTR